MHPSFILAPTCGKHQHIFVYVFSGAQCARIPLYFCSDCTSDDQRVSGADSVDRLRGRESPHAIHRGKMRIVSILCLLQKVLIVDELPKPAQPASQQAAMSVDRAAQAYQASYEPDKRCIIMG